MGSNSNDIGTVDEYPEKDIYIPDAEREADLTEGRGTLAWSNAFLDAMDRLLSRAGLRVL